MRDTTRRTSWPRASGPSSRTTGAEPACTASGCACVPAPGAPSCRAGAVRVAARYLPDLNVGFFGGASRTQPHEAVNGVRRDGEARDPRGAARRGRPCAAGGDATGHGPPRRVDRRQVGGFGRGTPQGGAPAAACGAIRFGRPRDSDQLVIRALPSSRHASSARLEQELRRGSAPGARVSGTGTVTAPRARRLRTAGTAAVRASDFVDPAVPAHGLAAAAGDVPLRSDVQPVCGRRADRVRPDAGELAGGGQARQMRTMASGRMGSDTGAPGMSRELRRCQRRLGPPGDARGEWNSCLISSASTSSTTRCRGSCGFGTSCSPRCWDRRTSSPGRCR